MATLHRPPVPGLRLHLRFGRLTGAGAGRTCGGGPRGNSEEAAGGCGQSRCDGVADGGPKTRNDPARRPGRGWRSPAHPHAASQSAVASGIPDTRLHSARTRRDCRVNPSGSTMPAGAAESEGKRPVGDGVTVRSRGRGHSDATGGGSFDAHDIVNDTDPGDDAQAIGSLASLISSTTVAPYSRRCVRAEPSSDEPADVFPVRVGDRDDRQE